MAASVASAHTIDFTSQRTFSRQVLAAHGTALDARDVDAMWQLNARQDGHLLAWKIIRYLDERDRFQNPRWLRALSRYEGPVHICWGEADAVAPVAVAKYLNQQVCPDATLTMLPDVGPFCETQAPEAWSEAVLGFYSGIER